MAKRSGSRSSRGERRAERERAERAREHGLPERRSAPVRARAEAPEPRDGDEQLDRGSEAPSIPLRKTSVPTLVKVLGIGVVILFGVYLLSRERDKALGDSTARPEPVPTSAPASSVAE
jgi:hypothetical protein